MRGALRSVRLVPLAFLAVMAAGTCLLKLPAATNPGMHTRWIDAAFTSVSATCLTGLSTVDVPHHWSLFGLVIILALMQVGGLGIMTLATGLTILVTGKIGLSGALISQAETHTSNNLGDMRRLVVRILYATVVTEAAVATILALRWHLAYAASWPRAAWHGIFHSVSAFTNASFALYSDSLIGFHSDGWIVLPLCAAVVAGGLGFPVYFELVRRWKLFRPSSWSVHSRITVLGTIVLLVFGIVALGAIEWGNPRTLGGYDLSGKVVGSVAMGVFPRTAGFNTIDYLNADRETLLITDVLMFIGGGSAGTSGGIKVSTFFLLGFVIWAEIRNQYDVHVWHRRIGRETVRQALSVALLAVGLVMGGCLVILGTADVELDRVLFEAVSAFATCGLSTGLSASLGVPGQVTLMVLMFCGRIGTITVASAMAMATRHHHYQLPEERPIVG